MNVPVRYLAWIGGATTAAPDATFSPLVSPIDETSASQIIESDAAVIDAAVKHAHATHLKHMEAPASKRIEWLQAAARRDLRGQAGRGLHPRLRGAGVASWRRGAAARRHCAGRGTVRLHGPGALWRCGGGDAVQWARQSPGS